MEQLSHMRIVHVYKANVVGVFISEVSQTTRDVAFERCRACDKHRET